VRGALYAVFSLAFRYPSEEIAAFFGDPGLPEALAEFPAHEAGPLIGELEAYVRSAEFPDDLARLERTYHALFHLEGGVPLYESVYRGAHEFQWVETLADVSGFYRAFGWEVVEERPDHLSAELEFMHVLALTEVRARAEAERGASREHLEITREAERAFLRDHLAVWVPAFARAVRRRAVEVGVPAAGFYGRMSTWLERFLQSECARLDVTPQAAALSPAWGEVEDEPTCPVGASGGDAGQDRCRAWGEALRRWEIPEHEEEGR